MPIFLRDEQSKKFQLGESLGSGGQGEVYEVINDPYLVIKRFIKPTKKLQDKINFLINYPPEAPKSFSHNSSHVFWTWPKKLLYTAEGEFDGYAMAKANGQMGYEFMQMDSRVSWKLRLHAAFRLTQLVDNIHSSGYVIGDLTPRNIFFSDQELPTIIDIDSFQIVHRITGQLLFPCPIIDPEYSPPEIKQNGQSNPLHKTEGDYFSLSIYVFQLLILGIHPFSGTFPKRHIQSIPASIKAGDFILSTRNIIPPEKMPSPDILTPEITKLFIRTFQEGHSNPQKRPNTKEWLAALGNVINGGLLDCAKNGNHFYSKHQKECPWCKYVQKNKVNPFGDKNAISIVAPPIIVPPVKKARRPTHTSGAQIVNQDNPNTNHPKTQWKDLTLWNTPIPSDLDPIGSLFARSEKHNKTQHIKRNQDRSSVKKENNKPSPNQNPNSKLLSVKRTKTEVFLLVTIRAIAILFPISIALVLYFYNSVGEKKPLLLPEPLILKIWEDKNVNGKVEKSEPPITSSIFQSKPILFRDKQKVAELCYKKPSYVLCESEDLVLSGDNFTISLELPEANGYFVTVGGKLTDANVITTKFPLQIDLTTPTEKSSLQTSSPVVIDEPSLPPDSNTTTSSTIVESATYSIGLAKYASLKGEICIDSNNDEVCDEDSNLALLGKLEFKKGKNDLHEETVYEATVNSDGLFVLNNIFPGQVTWEAPNDYSLLRIEPVDRKGNTKEATITESSDGENTGVEDDEVKQVQVLEFSSGEFKDIGTIVLQTIHEEVEETGAVTIQSDPSGAKVYIDYDYVGRTPLNNYSLAIGDHNLKITLVGYEDSSGYLNISKGNATRDFELIPIKNTRTTNETPNNEASSRKSTFNISGSVCFLDSQNNRRPDIGAPLFQYIKVTLYKVGSVDIYEAERAPSSNGHYSFGDFEPGVYKVVLKELRPIGYTIHNNKYIYSLNIINEAQSIEFCYYIN